ncbi:hypothetical protein [Pseudonocardia lacus]|uniref:hypothetical protein n=1 Tax=Pseudonocardia lacus TaxID=2835865 RepID=UPI001BDC942B|nr:hypothetical protein [Pseudonocardia lacus]
MDRVLLAAAFVQVTSAGDDMAHLVAFRLYEEGLMSGEGRYTAMCGKAVLAAAMATAPGRRCPLYWAFLDEPGS